MKFPILHRLVLLYIAFIFTFTGCSNKLSNSNNINLSFESFTDELFLEEITSNSINLHYCVDNPAALGIKDIEVSIGDFSQTARESSYSNIEETLSKLETYDYDSLSLENQLTYDLLDDYLSTQLTLSQYDLFQEPLSYSGGLQMELPILLAEYEFSSEQDVKDYLKILALIDRYFNQIIEFEAEKSYNCMFMSSQQCEMVINSCESFLLERDNHYLISSFKNKLDTLDLSEQKKASYKRQNLSILEKQVFPAYEKMITKLNELKNTGVNSNGICYLDGGKDYYKALIYAQTGCSDSIDVIFRRIENQRIEDLLVCSQLQANNTDLVWQCSSLEWEMISPDAMLQRLETAILEHFPAPPNCHYEINYVDSSLEEFLSPAFYIVAPFDNYTDNVIYINESYITSDIYAFTTLAHEGYPGHMYQTIMSYTYELPKVRGILNYEGFCEGWATYIEMMSYEYAGLEEDMASFLAHNQAAMLSLYATSDIGLHYYGWTLEDMKEFWNGYGITNEATINEITQLILSEPGNYLKYYVGYLEFLDLKDYAKDLFGENFSEVAFHQTVLDIGPAPFAILRKYLPLYYSPQT